MPPCARAGSRATTRETPSDLPAIVAYAVAGKTGGLSLVSTANLDPRYTYSSQAARIPAARLLTFEPQGRFAYAIGDGGRVNSFSIDAQTGRLRPLPGVGPVLRSARRLVVLSRRSASWWRRSSSERRDAG